MKPSLIANILPTLIEKRMSTTIVGAPGGGKTSVVHQIAGSLGIGLIEKHLPTMLVEDFGIPYMDNNTTTFSYRMPDWYPFEGKAGLPDKGILLFDDRNQANQDLQKVLANIQQARQLHGVPLADGWSVISTGNRTKDRAGANRILSHLSDREVEIELESNLDDSCKWALSHGVSPIIVAFWRFKPSMLHDFDPNRDKNPTPRSWVEGINPLIGSVPAEAELELYKGRIGEGAAIEFKSFHDMYRKLPNPDAVLMSPDTHAVPTEGSVLYALSGAIAQRATDNNFARVMTFSKRMPPEFTALVVRDAVTRDPALAATQAFTDWASNEGADVLL
jgi:hypothetical protein